MNTTTLLLKLLLSSFSSSFVADDLVHACGQHVEEQHAGEYASNVAFESMVSSCLVEHSFDVDAIQADDHTTR